MTTCYLSLGSNKGDKEAHLRKALELLHEKFTITKISSVYETEPVGVEGDWFLNCVVEFEAVRDVVEIMYHTQNIERKIGKNKTIGGARNVDIDILFYGDAVINTKDIKIPHPKLQERRFVLVPLNELNPNFMHPELKKTVKELLDECPDNSKVQLFRT